MKFLSVCSGIEAASVAWAPLGWKAWAFSEIEPFPCSVLAHYYPDTPNLGDMTKFKDWPDATLDVLCGGTPCQSFSVAGLRKGLDDPRGNLMLTFGAIAGKYQPRWLVWENVPGVLSTNNGKDFASFLDMLEELGYIIDCDILDAQFHGVPQRRRRVFVCGQHRDDLLSQMTDSSALTIAQCWQEILHGILVSACQEYENEQQNLDLAYLSKDGVMRRMKLFGLLGDQSSFRMLQMNLVESFLRFQADQRKSDAVRGENGKELTQGDLLTDFQEEVLSTLTEQSLSNALEESYEVMKSFITLTEIKTITPAQIFMCSKAVLNIAKLIQLLNQSSPCFWSAASSSLISIKEYTNYARYTTSDIFGDVERVSAWRDFIKQAESTSDAIGNIGVENFGEVFPISESLRGNPAPSRETGKEITDNAGFSTGTCSGKQTFGTLMANCGTKQWLGNQEALSGDYHVFALAGNTIGRQPENGGNGTGMGIGSESDPAYTLQASHSHAVAFGVGESPDVGHCLRAGASKADKHESTTYIKQAMKVRRLTPTECERLQGFPDDYTLVPYRNKPAADGPRYKALGNSWAVPVVRWIGERIEAVDTIWRAA